MAAAARWNDPTAHAGVPFGSIGPAPAFAQTVFIEGSNAAVLGDAHRCTFPQPPAHPLASAMVAGSATVFIAGRPAVRVGDPAVCGATVLIGANTVFIGG
jgi:uncharacterized Zn-binding protein involved in type VI secretion